MSVTIGTRVIARPRDGICAYGDVERVTPRRISFRTEAGELISRHPSDIRRL